MDATIKIKTILGVDRTTAIACLKLVELYVNTKHTNIVVNTCMDGSLEFHFDDEGGDMVSIEDVVKAVDAHTDDEGKLDDDITCILERIGEQNEQTGKKETGCDRQGKDLCVEH